MASPRTDATRRSALGKREQVRADPRVIRRARHHVLEHAERGPQPEPLQGARDADVRQPPRREAEQRLAPVRDRAAGWAHESGHGVEERGLAGAVGADDAHDLMCSDGQRNIVESDHAFKAHTDPGDLENHRLPA